MLLTEGIVPYTTFFHMNVYTYCSLRKKSARAVTVKVFDLTDLPFIKA